jgi:hypothetical protein
LKLARVMLSSDAEEGSSGALPKAYRTVLFDLPALPGT